MTQDLTQLYRTLTIFLASATNKTFDDIPDDTGTRTINDNGILEQEVDIIDPQNPDNQILVTITAKYLSDRPTIKTIQLLHWNKESEEFDVTETLLS